MRNRARRVRLVGAALVLLLALLFGASALVSAREIAALRARGVRATATVVATSTEGARTSWATLEFEVAGKMITASHVTRLTFSPYPKPGQQIEVVYDPVDPSIVASPGAIRNYGEALASGAASLVLGGLAVYTVVGPQLRASRARERGPGA
ncbi:DUF3592 domain-containing protein [Actinotalea lenta]|uniref:DUF3592 domain-containing protein n=1 Tax=Actinotalea lenta TaxID=3064654 RepID=UPI0033130968